VTKKKEVIQEDVFKPVMEGFQLQYNHARVGLMGEYQNKLIEGYKESKLLPHEAVMILLIVSDAIRGNFIQAMAKSKEAKAE